MLGTVMGMAAERDEFEDVVAVDENVAFQSLHPVGLLSLLHDFDVTASEAKVVLLVQ